jgi:DNA-directed RNA polymerase subunit M/transcription elongation factor TFIIS
MRNKERQRCINMLLTIITNNDELCQDIEESIYNYTEEKMKEEGKNSTSGDAITLYSTKCREILNNLDQESHVGNNHLLLKLLQGQIKASRVAYMTPQELYPQIWKDSIDMVKQKENLLYNQKQQGTTIHKCDKCEKRNTTSILVQTRSIDEPATEFVTCLECGNRWRRN